MDLFEQELPFLEIIATVQKRSHSRLIQPPIESFFFFQIKINVFKTLATTPPATPIIKLNNTKNLRSLKCLTRHFKNSDNNFKMLFLIFIIHKKRAVYVTALLNFLLN